MGRRKPAAHDILSQHLGRELSLAAPTVYGKHIQIKLSYQKQLVQFTKRLDQCQSPTHQGESGIICKLLY